MDDEAIRRIVRGNPVPDRLIRSLQRAPHVPEYDVSRYGEAAGRIGIPLSNQEVTVLRAIGDGGFTYGEAGDALGLSLESVKTYAMRARAKLGAKTTTQAVARAIRADLI